MQAAPQAPHRQEAQPVRAIPLVVPAVPAVQRTATATVALLPAPAVALGDRTLSGVKAGVPEQQGPSHGRGADRSDMTAEGSISVGPTAMNHTHTLVEVGEEVQDGTTYQIWDCTDPGCGYAELRPA